MNCKCCGAWFSSSDASQELCAACRRALARVSPIIESLTAELEQVKRERDAAINDIKALCARHSYSSCAFCKYDTADYGEEKCRECGFMDNWEWCGVKEGNNG